ncbi:MAG TPA: pitrilysin family protein [Candidatus Limnocylindria bacterium]|nr:pitrilysin family protein [Candidatus Limnocylindria bacterium]
MIDIKRRTERNSLRVAAVPIAGLRSVSVLLAMEAGQFFEPSGRPGVARLTAQTMLRGTARRNARAWSDALDGLGASARLDVGPHAAVFSGQCLADDLGAFLDLIAETVVTPALAPEGLEFVRSQALADLEEAKKDTRSVADQTWRELVYPPGHPFRTRSIGDEQVVRTTTIDEVRAYHRSAIRPTGSVIVLAGALDAGRGFELADRAFGAWTAEGAISRPNMLVALSGAQRRAVVVPDKTQADIVLGWPGLPRTDPRFTTAQVTNMVFAADTFASRAGQVVRDELGLAYYVFSTISGTAAQGPWTVRMGVNPENVERAIDVTFTELKKIRDGAIADDDLALARDKLVGELEVGRESPSGVAGMVLEAELFHLGDDHLERYPRELRAVTKDDVVRIARELLPIDRYALAIAGPELPPAG